MTNSMTPAIQLESISKSYRIFKNPQDRFKQALLDRFQKMGGRKDACALYREHWALKDISFEMHPGEAIGILGRNGAGKSTLLQIIAGTLEPTYGCLTTNGRITALLELGSGFNPEFTGRENVFLNGEILGLTRRDTQSRFDDIASFADIGDYIDQPVKTYSSGMMMRLAFAVQTAVEPKVLIVDEALSVGDMFFQAKCMARIKRLLDAGASLLFVSHDVGTVRQICKRTLLLDGGKAVYLGDVSTGADIYKKAHLSSYNELARRLNEEESQNTISDAVRTALPIEVEKEDQGSGPEKDSLHVPFYLLDRSLFEQKCDFGRLGNGSAAFANVMMSGINGNTDCFCFGEQVSLLQLVRFKKKLARVNVAFKLRTLQGVDAVFADTRLFGDMQYDYANGGLYLFRWHFTLNMGHGVYTVTSSMAHPPDESGRDWEFVDYVPISFQFRVLPRNQGMIDGLCVIPANLTVHRLDQEGT